MVPIWKARPCRSIEWSLNSKLVTKARPSIEWEVIEMVVKLNEMTKWAAESTTAIIHKSFCWAAVPFLSWASPSSKRSGGLRTMTPEWMTEVILIQASLWNNILIFRKSLWLMYIVPGLSLTQSTDNMYLLVSLSSPGQGKTTKGIGTVTLMLHVLSFVLRITYHLIPKRGSGMRMVFVFAGETEWQLIQYQKVYQSDPQIINKDWISSWFD